MNRHPEGRFLQTCRSLACCTASGTGGAITALLLMATACVTPARAVTLAEKGQARAVILVPAKPSPVVEGAARVLRDHLKQMSGAELPIRTEDRITGSPSPDQAWVLVGEGKLAGKLGLTSKGLGPGGIVQAAKGHVLALFGTDAHTPSDPNGTRYAVTTFLEDRLGVRYLWPGDLGKVVPRRGTITVADFQHRFAPQLAQRRIRSLGYHDRIQVGLDLLHDDPVARPPSSNSDWPRSTK